MEAVARAKNVKDLLKVFLDCRDLVHHESSPGHNLISYAQVEP